MADPLSARSLIVEDALHSRGKLDDDDLIQEARELDVDLKGKRRAKDDERMQHDNSDSQHKASSSSSNSSSSNSRSSSEHIQVRDHAYARTRPRRRTSSTSTPRAAASQTKTVYLQHGREEEDDDDDNDNEGADSSTTPLHDRQHRGVRRKASLLDGLLDKDGLPVASPGMSKQQLRHIFWQNVLINAMLILAWYCCSTLISFYSTCLCLDTKAGAIKLTVSCADKWMFSEKYYGFGFPLFVTSCHMVVQFTLCSIVLGIFPSLRPAKRPTPYDYGTKALPCGIATGLDIGLSNLSLKVITLTFYTMCKSSVLGFVLFFAFLFKLERPTIPLIGIIAIITAGVIMMVSGETEYHFWGMLQVLTASALSGLRWSLTQILLDKEQMGMNNPFATLFWLAPIMGVCLAICSIFVEGWWTILTSGFFDGLDRSLITIGVIILPGCIAFSMNVAEFALIKRTSVVTLSVAGIFKEVATILLSTLIFKDQLTPINVSGLCVALSGIIAYNYLKFSGYKKAEKEILAGKTPLAGTPENGDYALRRADVEGQFQLVGDNDFDSSDESDFGEANAGRNRLQKADDSIVHLPSYAYTHNQQEQQEETRRLETEVQRDPLLVEIDRESNQLQGSMQKNLLEADNSRGDLYETLDHVRGT